MYFLSENKNLTSTLMYSGFMILAGIVLEIIHRMKRSTRLKDLIYAAAFFILIPVLTLNFIEFASVTVWALAFIFLFISIAMVSKIIQIAVATSILLTQLVVFILKPSILMNIDVSDHVGRLGLSVIAIWIAFFVMNVFRSKLLDNEYQISFQSLVTEISTHYISVGEKGFDEVTNETLQNE